MEQSAVLPCINQYRIDQLAELAKTLPIEKPLNFYSFTGRDGVEIIAKDMYPPLHAPGAVDFFFFVGIHNYGYWHGEEKYEGPLFGTFNGKKVKGSDLLWKMLLKEFTEDPERLSPKRLANISLADHQTMFSDDNGPVGILCIPERLTLSRNFGTWFIQRKYFCETPSILVAQLHESKTPGRDLVDTLINPYNGVPGYIEDPLEKKVHLLLMTLVQRPERFVKLEQAFIMKPMVDYHLMRLALRLGLVELPMDWINENKERSFTSAARESMVRRAVWSATMEVVRLSGRTMPEIDNLMWSARRFCPEMEEPNCGACMLKNACMQKTELFQPVIRTTAY